jgi:hypothetical protein
VSEIDVMQDIFVAAPDILTGGRSSEWQPIADGLWRWTVSTIEPVTMRAARLVTRPELLHDKRTPE